MTLEELINSIEADIERDRRDLEAILDQARAQGREELTRTEDLRAEAIFSRLEQNKRKLENAKNVKAEEDEATRKSQIVIDNPALPTKRNSNREPSRNDWLRSADGGIATVERGESFASHPVVAREMVRYSERDRHIVEAHGDFGQWVRAMTTSGASAIVPTLWSSEIIDLARNEAVFLQAGVRTVPMDAKIVQIGRLTTDATAAFKAEGDPVSASDLAFDYVQLSAKSMGALAVASVEFLQDAPEAGSLIQASIAKAMALQIDKYILYGGVAAADPSGFDLDSAVEPVNGIVAELLAHASGNVYGPETNGTAQTAASPFNELLNYYSPVMTKSDRMITLG